MKDFNAELAPFIEQSLSNACACHGDLGLDQVDFLLHLYSVVNRRVGTAPPAVAAEFVRQLHLNDLYLALACARGGEAAWDRFLSLYTEPIRLACKSICPPDTAQEFAAGLPGELFLPDATGHSRIASYEGLSSLTTWLSAVIRHWAGGERRRKVNNMERLDRIPEIVDEAGLRVIEAALTADRYRDCISDSVDKAIGLLSERERVILRLRYGQQMQVSQVARLLEVKPPAISRQLDRTRCRLRDRVIAILSTKHRLGSAAIEDCLSVITENPQYCSFTLG